MSQQNILVIINAAPYGNENSLSGMRVALMLADKPSKPSVTVFLMSDAVVMALPNQQHASGNTLQQMVENFVELGGTVRVCKTCASNRGIEGLELIKGATIGNLGELTDCIVEFDKVLTF